MTKLTKNFMFIITTLIGFVAIGAFYFFYSEQKEFSTKQKEFLLALNAIEVNEARLEYILLQNYIYAYNNNDDVAHMLESLERSFNDLIQSQILLEENYMPLQEDIGKLKNEIDRLFVSVQRFVMLNASIKNSLIFLAAYDNKFSHFKDPQLFFKAGKIVESLLYARRMNDITFIQKDFRLPLKPDYSAEEKRFISTFNKHVEFILNTFPQLLKLQKEIDNNKILELVRKIKKDFTQISLHDTTLLNTFSVILFLIFTATYLYLIFILSRYAKEHDKLLETTNSLKHLIYHDVLTELKNRIAFDKEKLLLLKPMVMIINIDRFKDINDAYGTQVGDIMLKEVADFLQESLHDVKGLIDIYRIGGDEFCALFENTDTLYIQRLAENLIERIRTKEFLISNYEINISFSIAINCVKPLLENADLALKLIKKDRNKKVIVYDERLNLQEAVHNNIKTINLVKKALKHDGVVPYFQPIINLRTGKIEKYEALVRIIDADDVISPYRFLDISKKTSLYQDITRAVIEKTIQTALQYPQYRFSINLSMSDILNEPLIEELFELFEHHISVANRIDIELLETENLTDLSSVKDFIDRLHSFGSLVLIDDFGSGYSNFSYFSELEIDIVKIDGSIINEIATNKRKLHMLESIAMFCKGMNLKIVAEFVDNAEIVSLLQGLEIDYAQGYYYAPPLPKPLQEESAEDLSL